MAVALRENTLKLAPPLTRVAPIGELCPGVMAGRIGVWAIWICLRSAWLFVQPPMLVSPKAKVLWLRDRRLWFAWLFRTGWTWLRTGLRGPGRLRLNHFGGKVSEGFKNFFSFHGIAIWLFCRSDT